MGELPDDAPEEPPLFEDPPLPTGVLLVGGESSAGGGLVEDPPGSEMLTSGASEEVPGRDTPITGWLEDDDDEPGSEIPISEACRAEAPGGDTTLDLGGGTTLDSRSLTALGESAARAFVHAVRQSAASNIADSHAVIARRRSIVVELAGPEDPRQPLM